MMQKKERGGEKGQKALTYRRTEICINILKSLDHMSFGVIMQEKLDSHGNISLFGKRKDFVLLFPAFL